MKDPQPSILVVGTGSMACFFAARLSAAGISVCMLGTWVHALDVLRQKGITVLEADGREHTYPVQASHDPSAYAGVRFAVVLVKSWQTGRAARQLSECLAGDGVALTLQNGVGNQEKLAAILGEQRVALGVTTYGANLVGVARVHPAGEGIITLGVHPLMSQMAEIFRLGGFAVDLSPDPRALLWGKLVINAAINPITALLGITNGELLERPTARLLMANLALETAAVAEAQGVHLHFPDPVTMVEDIAQRTAVNRSSMLQDVTRGSPTEIDAICGAIVEAGERSGIATPANRVVWQLVKALQ